MSGSSTNLSTGRRGGVDVKSLARLVASQVGQGEACYGSGTFVGIVHSSRIIRQPEINRKISSVKLGIGHCLPNTTLLIIPSHADLSPTFKRTRPTRLPEGRNSSRIEDGNYDNNSGNLIGSCL